MKKPARQGAALCALLASTAIAAPAFAQPTAYQHQDRNGVDLTTGSFNFSLVEGSIGTGPGAIALVRQGAGGSTDNLYVRFTRSVQNSVASIVLTFGARSESFSGASSATSFIAQQGNGATLTKINASEYRYTAADGSVTTYAPPPGLTNATNNGYCSVGQETSCGLIAVSTVQPGGATTTYLWDVGENCTDGWDRWGEPTSTCAQFWRQRGLSNNSGYNIRFSFQQEANPATGLPGTAWHTRSGAILSNSAVPAAPTRSVAYATPAAGVTEITTDGGQTWRISRDANLYVAAIRRPGSTSDNVTVTYAAGTTTGVVASVTADGVTTNYARSVSGSTGTMTVTNALNQQSVIVSDLTIGRPISMTDPLGRTSTVQYDSSGRPAQMAAPEGNATILTYDSRGNVIQTQIVAAPGSSDAAITTSASYDATCSNVVICNRPNSTTDGRGNVTDYTFDATHGGVLTVTAPAVIVGGATVRPQSRTTYAQVNGVALPVESSSCRTSASCAGTSDEVRTTVAYNMNHLPTTVTSGDGAGSLAATQIMTYDATGDVLTIDGPLAGSADTVRYRYDAARQRIGTVSPDPDGTGPLPHRATRVTYRPDGQVSRTEQGITNGQSDADWANFIMLDQTDTVFDANSRPWTVSHAAGGAMHSVSQTSYDALGRPDCVAQRMNPASWSNLPTSACAHAPQGSFGPDRISRTVRDAAGQVTQVRSAVGTPLETADVTTTYSANGQALTVTDAENNRTSYEYDGHGRTRRTYFPVIAQGANASAAADYEENGYDANGNVVSRRNRAGEVATFTIDALNRIAVKTLPGAEPQVAYSYDLQGRMLSAAQGSHTVSFTYDALGRRLTQTNPLGTIGSTWDLAGRRTRITHPGGAYFVDQDYLVTGEMAAIRENGATSGLGVVATFAYDMRGRRTALTRSNGVVTTYAYDPASRLATLGHDLAGSTLDVTSGFTHNPAGQIVANTRSNDLYSHRPAAATTFSTANGLNQLATHAGGTPAYDARGNLTAQGGRIFSYSSENLLASGTINGRTFTWTYDPLMRLYHQGLSGATPRSWLMDGNDAIVTMLGTNLLAREIYGPGENELLYSIDNQNRRRWFTADERGSILSGTDETGGTSSVITYDEYGVPSALSYQHNYTGAQYLGISGLIYMRARIYDPSLGRFLQTDPIGYGDGMNMYAYVGGDPVNATDPSGLTIVVCGGVWINGECKSHRSLTDLMARMSDSGDNSDALASLGGSAAVAQDGRIPNCLGPSRATAGGMSLATNRGLDEIYGNRSDRRRTVPLTSEFSAINRLPDFTQDGWNTSWSGHSRDAYERPLPNSVYVLKIYIGDKNFGGRNTVTITNPPVRESTSSITSLTGLARLSTPVARRTTCVGLASRWLK